MCCFTRCCSSSSARPPLAGWALCITQGMWFARSPEVVHSPFMETLVWLRVPGDVVFAIRLLTGAKARPAVAVPVGVKRA